jgi:hypothetical protein
MWTKIFGSLQKRNLLSSVASWNDDVSLQGVQEFSIRKLEVNILPNPQSPIPNHQSLISTTNIPHNHILPNLQQG